MAHEIGENAFPVKADVGDAKQVEEMADAVYRKWGRVDVLINNAGITKDSLMIKLKEAEWDEILRVNLKGCFNTIKMFSHAMINSGTGHIIKISSYSGIKGREGQAAFLEKRPTNFWKFRKAQLEGKTEGGAGAQEKIREKRKC